MNKYTPPARPKIYHIVNVDRLSSILVDGAIWCDRKIVAEPRPGTTIGMGEIKARRMALPVKCWPGDVVGDYVPFYFCPRSIMLFVIHCANAPDLAYRGGQAPVVHLEADFHDVVRRARDASRKWAFTLSNAGAAYTEFRADLEGLSDVNWPAVASTDFRSPEVKEGKQAEFLIRDSFPWRRVDRIGVHSERMAQRVANIIARADHRPEVRVMPAWYY